MQMGRINKLLLLKKKKEKKNKLQNVYFVVKSILTVDITLLIEPQQTSGLVLFTDHYFTRSNSYFVLSIIIMFSYYKSSNVKRTVFYLW